MNGYPLWVGLGAALGLWRVWRSAPQRQAALWVDLALILLSMTLLGARLFYVALNWPYFAEHPLEIASFAQGGLSWPGAAAGAALVIGWFVLRYTDPTEMRKSHFSLGLTCDRLYPLLPPLVVACWLGCWQIGVANGFALPERTWWGIPVLNDNGEITYRFPLQAAAATALLLFFAVLESRVSARRPAGRLSALAFLGFMIHLLAASLLAGDPAPTWMGLRVETWAAMLFLGLFLIFIAIWPISTRVLRRLPLSGV